MGQPLRIVTIVNGKELSGPEAERVRIEASYGVKAARMIERRIERLPDCPERRSVGRAILAVEEGLVRAFWTIARQPIPVNASPRQARRCGLDYFHDHSDSLARFIDAAGGKWGSEAPRPSLPSSKSIDDANRTLDWLLFIDDENLRKLLVVGATSKRGDVGRNVNWSRVRDNMPQLAGLSVRTLKWRYREALRIIVSELTLARAA